MNAGDLWNGKSSRRRTDSPWRTITDRVQDIDNRFERRGRGREQKRRCAAAGVIIANGAKRFGRSFHRVATDGAVNVKIDKPRREIVSAKIDNFFAGCARSWSNFGDFSIPDDLLDAVANSVREN
jgi:hypothetical protein